MEILKPMRPTRGNKPSASPKKTFTCKWCKKESPKKKMWDHESCNGCIYRLRSSLFACFLE